MQSHLLISMFIYLLVLLLIGFYFGRKNKTSADYLVGGRRLPTWAVILTLTATMFGGGMLVGRTQYAYNNGSMFYVYSFLPFISFILVALLINKMKGFSNCTTVTEYLERRYNSRFLRVSCSALSMVSHIGITASQVYALINILTAMGLGNVKLNAFICMVIIIALTVQGGMLAVTATDCFQIVIVMVGVVALFITVIAGHGGMGSLWDKLNSIAPSLPQDYMSFITEEKAWILLWMMTPGLMYMLIGQEGYQRLFACRNINESRKAAVISGSLMTAISILPVVFGMAARLDFPELAANNTTATALAQMVLKYMPGFGGGLLLCAILSAILSTGDSLLSAATSHFVNDFWMLYIDKDTSLNDRKLLRVSRIFTLTAGAVALFVSFTLTDILTPMIYCYTIYTAGAFTPIVIGCLWKGANKIGASAGLIVGCGTALSGIMGMKIGSMPGELLSVILAVLITVAVSVMTGGSHVQEDKA